MIEGFSEPVYYGVRGGIKKFYRVDAGRRACGNAGSYRRRNCGVNDGDTGHGDGRKKNPHPESLYWAEGEGDTAAQSVIGCIKIEDELLFEA